MPASAQEEEEDTCGCGVGPAAVVVPGRGGWCSRECAANLHALACAAACEHNGTAPPVVVFCRGAVDETFQSCAAAKHTATERVGDAFGSADAFVANAFRSVAIGVSEQPPCATSAQLERCEPARHGRAAGSGGECRIAAHVTLPGACWALVCTALPMVLAVIASCICLVQACRQRARQRRPPTRRSAAAGARGRARESAERAMAEGGLEPLRAR